MNRRREMLLKKSGGRLPEEYQAVEWVEGRNAVHIDTGIPCREIEEVVCIYGKASTGVRDIAVAVGRVEGDKRYCPCQYYNSSATDLLGAGFMFASTWGPSHIIGDGLISADVKCKAREPVYAEFDGTIVSNYVIAPSYDFTLWLFSASEQYWNLPIRIKNVEIIGSDNQLLRKYVACRRKNDGYYGLYDFVTEEFYTAPNKSSFIGGNDL